MGAANRLPKLPRVQQEHEFLGYARDDDGRKVTNGRSHGRRGGVGGLCLLGRNRNVDLVSSAQCNYMSSIAQSQREQDKNDRTVTPAPWSRSDLLGRTEGDDAAH